MSIEVKGRAGHGVPQALGDGQDIRIAVNEDAGHGMSKRMRMDVRKVVFPAEFVQPAVHAVRVHGLPGILSEDISGFDPPVSHDPSRSFLFLAISRQQPYSEYAKHDEKVGRMAAPAFSDVYLETVETTENEG